MNKIRNYFILTIFFFMSFIINVSAMDIGEIKEFNYTGDYQEWIVPESGFYKVELWGAQGGNNPTAIGGYGGYTAGDIFLKRGTKLLCRAKKIWNT